MQNFFRNACIRIYVALQVFAAQEPVRLRAALLSLVAAVAVLFPAVADAEITDSVIGVAVVALPLLVGESTRKRVTPVSE
ncbi:hypothetical protein ACWDX6_24135 [Streptomyces sp. NPDC003027]